MEIDEYEAEPVPLAFSTALAPSVVFAQTYTVRAPVFAPALMSSNAAFSVAYGVKLISTLPPLAQIDCGVGVGVFVFVEVAVLVAVFVAVAAGMLTLPLVRGLIPGEPSLKRFV